jgi:LCP family protein required for cell wall assembly
MERPAAVGTPTKPSRRRRAWMRPVLLGASATVALVIAAGSAGGVALLYYAKGQIVTIQVPKDRGESSAVSGLCADVCTYLIMGSDSRAGLSKQEQVRFGSPKTEPGHRSDTIILVRLDPREKKAQVVSFPRDLWVHIPGHGMGKITSAFEDGPYRVSEVVHRLTGLQVDHLLVVRLAGFEGVVRAIGTVPICIDRPLVDPTGYSGLNLPHAGCYDLDAQEALAFVRARHIACQGGIPDFYRISRQQQFLRAVLAKMLRPSIVFHAGSIIPAVLGNISVDRGLKSAGIPEMLHLVRELAGVDTGRVDFRSVPTVPATVHTPDGTVDIVRLRPQAKLLFKRLRQGSPPGEIGKSLELTPPSPAVVEVRIVDHRSNGGAAKVHRYLTEAGFDITPVASSDARTAGRPVILYAAGDKPEADVVHGFLPAIPLRQAPPAEVAGVDVEVVIDASYHGLGVAEPRSGSKPPSGTSCA